MAALVQRIRAGVSMRHSDADARLMARTLTALYFSGGTIGALSLLLPHPAGADDAALWSNVAIAFVAALAGLLTAGRLPGWTYQLWILAGAVVITRAIFYSNEPGGFYTFWYLWAGLYAFFFFGRFWGVVHTATIGAMYAWALSAVPGAGAPIAYWLLTIGTIAVAGFLVDYLARRLRSELAGSMSRARNLAAIGAVAHELSRRVETAEVEPAICRALVTVTGAGASAVWKPSSDGRGLAAAASVGADLSREFLSFVSPRSGAVKAFSTAEPFFVADARGNPQVDQGIVKLSGARSCLWQPVLRDGAPVAVLAVYWREAVPKPSREVVQLMGLLASEASVAIERAELVERLESAALTDDLTGLPNRRAWEEALDREIARARRDGTPLCVAMLDLDRFKVYNDAHGHQAGDRLLKSAAANWRQRLRATDILARHGGEEFGLALPKTELDEGLALVEELRRSMPSGETCSAGVARWDGSESPDALVDRADQALYHAKRDGRDRVIATTESVESVD